MAMNPDECDHDWQISVLTPIGYDPHTPLPMSAPTVTYCTACRAIFDPAPPTTDESDVWHLVVENDDCVPYITGCDCTIGHDHYDYEVTA